MPSPIFEIVRRSISDAEKISLLEIAIKAGANLEDQDPDDANISILHAATSSKSGEHLLNWLLNRSPTLIHATSSYGTNALFYAAKHNNMAAVQFFLKHPKSRELVLAVNKSNITLNHFASLSGNIAMLNLAMECRGDALFSLDDKDPTLGLGQAMYDVSELGHIEMMQYLFEKLKAPLEHSLMNGWGPLHRAAETGRTDAITWLVANKADVNLPTRSPRSQWAGTALLIAAGNGKDQAVAKLIELKANLDSYDNEKRHALHLATEYGHQATVRLLVKSKVDVNIQTQDQWGNTAAYVASGFGQLTCLETLIELKANYNTANLSGWHPIHNASSYGHPDVIRLLVANKANINEQNKDKETPLILASRAGKLETVRTLINLNADMNSTASDGTQSIHGAARYGRPDVIELLVEHKVNHDSLWHPPRHTPAMVATSYGQTNALEKLLELKADCHKPHQLNAPNFAQKYLIQRAAGAGSLGIVKLLVTKHGVNVNFVAPRENLSTLVPGEFLGSSWPTLNTPLHFAAQSGHIPTIIWLLRNGASPHAEQDRGLIPFQSALQSGKIEAMIALYDPSYLRYIASPLRQTPNAQYYILNPRPILSTIIADAIHPEKAWGALTEEYNSRGDESLSFPIPHAQKDLYVALAKEQHRFMLDRKAEYIEVRAIEEAMKFLIPIICAQKTLIYSKKLPDVINNIIFSYLIVSEFSAFSKTLPAEIISVAKEITPRSQLLDASPLAYRISFWRKLNIRSATNQLLITLASQSAHVKMSIWQELGKDPAIQSLTESTAPRSESKDVQPPSTKRQRG